MAEEIIVNVDGLPVPVDPARWESDRKNYRYEIRAERRSVALTPDQYDEADDYDTLVGDDS